LIKQDVVESSLRYFDVEVCACVCLCVINNKDDATVHNDNNDCIEGNSTLPGKRTSMHDNLTLVDNKLYTGAYVDVQPSSPSAVSRKNTLVTTHVMSTLLS
jgi:hypothetical protein